MPNILQYLSGFGNHFSTEAISGALPKGQNSPQKVPYDLYAEQLSGSAFTAPRHHNLKCWLYRIRPSVLHHEFKPFTADKYFTIDIHHPVAPNQLRWDPIPFPKKSLNFIDGLTTFAVNGDLRLRQGAAIHLYSMNASMKDTFFYNADGEFLIVPQEGELRFKTECGILDVTPSDIIVIPRGIKFQVELRSKQARGYICENYGSPFRLPELGVIGANGLANTRDFQYPTAWYEKKSGDYQLIAKFHGSLWQAKIKHSPLDVVAWHGNYAPYKYSLKLFNTINTVSFDHIDPSIFTVLTSPSNTPGVANVDFVIFPERWMVAEHTFRPPYFHRNMMSEFMGLIYGPYDAKEEGFLPGGCSLHNCMSAHGPDKEAYEKAVNNPLKPARYDGNLAIMFESSLVWQPTAFAWNANFRQKNYLESWQGLEAKFSDTQK
ncbi:MAG: homogentisate 1,2-dioxygenase [Proteobacteria bacterium]|nr:homogentisate 1,2-dioxygenase [Pseudomonadota bacterium]